jgi:hypothetical protein
MEAENDVVFFLDSWLWLGLWVHTGSAERRMAGTPSAPIAAARATSSFSVLPTFRDACDLLRETMLKMIWPAPPTPGYLTNDDGG